MMDNRASVAKKVSWRIGEHCWRQSGSERGWSEPVRWWRCLSPLRMFFAKHLLGVAAQNAGNVTAPS